MTSPEPVYGPQPPTVEDVVNAQSALTYAAPDHFAERTADLDQTEAAWLGRWAPEPEPEAGG
jgi:hypothetical protein